MSGPGFRGRGFGPRSNRLQNPHGGFTGPHPNFNQNRRPPNHPNFSPCPNFNQNRRPDGRRPPGPDGWRDNSGQSPGRFRHSGNGPQFPGPNQGFNQGHNQGHQRHYYNNGPGGYHERGRGFRPGRFIGRPGRDSDRESIRERERHRYPRDDKRNFFEEFQEPPLGSEKERQQKISKSVDELKQTLSSFTEEDSINFWEDNFSPPSPGVNNPSTSTKGIPELMHGPPELNLTFNDFKVIGRVDLDTSSKSDSTPNNEKDNAVFNGAKDSAKTDEQGSRNEVFIEDCLYLNDPQEEEFIAQLDTRLNDCSIAPNSSEVPELNNQNEKPTKSNQSEEFLATEKIISEFQINERSNLLSENSPNLRLDIDPSFTENISDQQNELSNFNNGIFDLVNESNFEGSEGAGQNLQQNLQENLQENLKENLQTEFNFDKSESQQLPEANVKLFTAFETTEPPSEIVQGGSESNLSFEHHGNFGIEDDSIQIQEQDQIFENEALPGLSQQESNLFFEELGQMEGNFPESEQEIFKPKENEELKQSEEKPDQVERIAEANEKSLVEDTEPLESQPLEPPPMFDLNMMEYSKSSRDSKSHKKPLQPPPMFDPMFPDLLQNCEESNSSFQSQNQKEPLQPPPMFELEEPPDFLQDCEERSNSSIKKSKKLDYREESQHSSSSFDQIKRQEEILQPPPAFDPRGPPPSVSIVGEERSFKPPGFVNQEEVIQPPKVFDPRLSSQQRMDFVSGPEIVPWTGPIGDYNMATNFVPSMHVPQMSQPNFIPNVGYNMVIPPMASVPIDYPPPLPQEKPMAPPLPADPHPEPLVLSMADELEDMQEAMEFATQLMKMTESNGDKSEEHKKEKKSKKRDEKCKERNKDSKKEERKKKEENVEYGPILLPEMIEERREVEEEKKTPHEGSLITVPDTEEDTSFADDQIRPKVVFNLNKVKRICKVDEWQQQQQIEDSEDAKGRRKKFLKDKERLDKEKENQVLENQVLGEKADDERRRRRRRSKDENKLREEKSLNYRTEEKPSTSTFRADDSRKEKKEGSLENQESWKNRVIKQFLSMDRNDFHNMINNTSRRRFDIAMKQLVKERKTSLSQEMRNTEEEKIRHFDRDQFMSQLNQMLDPEASESVDISNLPTEFIHHLSMVLHLDPMPGGSEEGGGEIEMMDSEDFLQQIGLDNKIQRHPEQNILEEEYLHLPEQPSPTLMQPVVEKKKRHHEKKLVHVVRAKDSESKGEPYEQAGTSRISKETQKLSRERERENGEVTSVRVSTREVQSREAQLREAQLRDEQIREQQAKCQQIRDQHFREQQLRDQQFKEKQQQIREQHIREQQAKEAREQQLREAKARELKAREAKLAQMREQELRDAEIRESEIRELQKKQAQLRAQLAKELLVSGSSTLKAGSPPHLTSILDDIFKPGLTKGKPDRAEPKAKPNRSETVTKLPGKYPTLGTMERTLDDIFSAGIAKAKASLKTSVEPSLEQQQQWTRKKRENVDTFRNLTKEEWEAKHGRSMSDSFEKEFNSLMLRKSETEILHSKGKEVRTLEVSDRSQKKTYQWDETPLPERTNDENAERILVRNKENLEEGELIESNNDSDNDSSSSSSYSSGSLSSENIAPDVTKLLKVIKEREKVAKKKTLNEAIRDEVAADIEKRKREKERHKERKSRKRKKREKKGKKRKRTRKHKKKTKRNSNSESEKELPEKLLTEDEIKKEVKTEPTPERKLNKKLEPSSTVNKTLNSVPGVKTLVNPPAKVNVDYGQKSHLTKTKAQLKQMPENPVALVETAVQVENSVPKETLVQVETSVQAENPVPDEAAAKTWVCKLNAETQTQIPTESSKVQEEKCQKTGGVDKEDTIENKQKVGVKENEKAKEQKEKNLEKATSASKVPEAPTEPVVEVEKQREDLPKSSECAEPSVVEEKTLEVPKEPKEPKELKEGREPKEAKEVEVSIKKLDEKKVKPAGKSQESVREKKPNRIDIQAYKARTLERKKKEQEKLKEIVKNPISLTTDLLNIPLKNKSRITEPTAVLGEAEKVLDSLTSKTNSKKDSKTLAAQKPAEKDKKDDIERLKSSTVLRDPRLASKTALEQNTQEKKSEKLDPNKNKVIDSQDASKFKFIKSEGGKELKLKNKPKSAKKIKMSTALVVVEQKIESPLRKTSISESEPQKSLNLKPSKTIENSKRKEKIATKKDNLPNEKNKSDFSKETPIKDASNDKVEKPYKPVRKLKIYGKNNEKIEKIEKLISDGLPDTVPSEEISKYYVMELENYPTLLQDLIEDPVDVCPAKEVFFGNMSLKEDDISDMKPNFEIGDEKKDLEMEEINPIENIIFDTVDLELQTPHMYEINCHEKPELFHFGIEDSDPNLRLGSSELPSILTEQEMLPLESEVKLNPLPKITKSLMEEMSSESDNFLIRDNLRIEVNSPDYKNEPEQNVQELFEPTNYKNVSTFKNLENKIQDFEKFDVTALETSVRNHVIVSREIGDSAGDSAVDSDLIQLIKVSQNLQDMQEKWSNEGERNLPPVGEECAQLDLFTTNANLDKESPANDNKDSYLLKAIPLENVSEPVTSDVSFLASGFEDSLKNLTPQTDENREHSNTNFQVNLTKPTKISEIVLQRGVTILRPELNDFEARVASEKSISTSEQESEAGKGQSSNSENFEVKNLETAGNLKEEVDMGVRHLNQRGSDKNLHKVKHKRKMKRKKDKIKEEVREAIKEVIKPITTHSLLERMKEIDNEIQKLMSEKSKLYEQMAEMQQKAIPPENKDLLSKEKLEVNGKKQKKSSPEDDEVAFFSKENSKVRLNLASGDEETFPEKKSKKSRSERSHKLKKPLSDSSSEDEEPKNLKEKENFDSPDSEFENLSLMQMKIRMKSHSKRIKSSSEDEKEETKEIEKKEKKNRAKSVMKVSNFDEDKVEKNVQKRPKSVMLFSKEKSSEEEKKKKKEILERSKSAMRLSSKVTSSEVSSGDEEVSILSKKSNKNVTEAFQRPKSAMKLSNSKILSSEDEEKKDKVKEKIAEKRKRPKSVMMKSSKNEESEEEIKKKKPKEAAILNTEQKIFVKIRGKHEREKSKKKEKVEKIEEKEDKKKVGMPFVQVNRLEEFQKKKIEKEKIKKANSASPKKKEDLDKKRVRALDSALIYSDESTLETLEPAKDIKLKKNNTGLALLEQSFRKEMAQAKKARSEEKKKPPQPEKKNQIEVPKSDKIENQNLIKDQSDEKLENCNKNNERQTPEKSTKLDLCSEISTPDDQSPCKGFDTLSKIQETVSLVNSRTQQVAKILITEINEEESLNEEVQRINSNLVEKNLQDKEKIEEFPQPSLKEFSDKDSNKSEIERSALLSPISDDSTLSGDSSKKRKRPATSLSRGEKIKARRISKPQESEEEEKRSRASSRQKRESQTPTTDSEPLKKRKRTSGDKLAEKVLYSRIRDLLKSEMRTRRKDRKKRKVSREDMENCRVKLVDLKHTYMREELPQAVLKRLGLSRINLPSRESRILIDNLSLQEEIMRVSEIKRISIDESSEGSKNETTLYIFKMNQVNKLEAVKVTEEKKEDKVEKNKNERIEDQKAEEEVSIDKEKEKHVMREPEVENKEEVPVENCIISNSPTPEKVASQVENLIETRGEENQSQIENIEDEEIELPKIQYTVHKGPILDIKIIGDSFLAASEDGAIYRYSQTSNGILNIYKGHTHAVTCLYVLNPDPLNPSRRWMYSGSLDGSMRCYDIGTGEQMQSPIAMGSAVQCMDQAWGAIFIGTTSGHVSRYHIKAAELKGDTIQFSKKSVLALKATSEGPRKVLIVASRNQPIMIRDAFTGLFLRQISGQKNYTVYSLLRNNNLIYFGTSSTSIPVYDFITGEQKVQYNAGVGVVCMYLYERLLFAGCYDGNIYIFDIQEQKLVCSIPGPGKMLLSMAIINKRIIAGSKDRSLHCWNMPKQAQDLLDEKT